MRYATYVRTLTFVFLAATLMSCGDTGTARNDAAPSDATATDAVTQSDGGVDAGLDPDANPSGTQQEGQFCETLPAGGPYCVEGITCCDDKICRSDCGSGGGIACNGKVDCNGGDVCCQVDVSRLCTPKKTCGDLGGTEVP